MSNGISIELSELIALQRYAKNSRYHPKGTAQRIGNHLSNLRGRGMDFSEARNYQAGDEVRHMEWRVTARTGRPHVKVYQEERERPVVLATDFSPSMYFGTRIALKSVVAAELAAIIAWTSAHQGDRVGGVIFSRDTHHEFTPRSRQAGVLPYLSALSHYTFNHQSTGYGNTSPTTFNNALLRLQRITKPGSILVLISDFYHLDEQSEQYLRRLNQKNDLLLYHICDPLELSPPQPNEYAITNGTQELVLDTTLDAVRFAYQFYTEQRITALQAQCKRLNIQYTQATPHCKLSDLVNQTFPRRTHG